jgi:hypothetical protein
MNDERVSDHVASPFVVSDADFAQDFTFVAKARAAERWQSTEQRFDAMLEAVDARTKLYGPADGLRASGVPTDAPSKIAGNRNLTRTRTARSSLRSTISSAHAPEVG